MPSLTADRWIANGEALLLSKIFETLAHSLCMTVRRSINNFEPSGFLAMVVIKRNFLWAEKHFSTALLYSQLVSATALGGSSAPFPYLLRDQRINSFAFLDILGDSCSYKLIKVLDRRRERLRRRGGWKILDGRRSARSA